MTGGLRNLKHIAHIAGWWYKVGIGLVGFKVYGNYFGYCFLLMAVAGGNSKVCKERKQRYVNIFFHRY